MAGTLLSLAAVLISLAGTADGGERVDELAGRLRDHVRALSVDIGERNYLKPGNLEAAASYVAGELAKSGFSPVREEYRVGDAVFANIVAERKGAREPAEVIVIGAHYDTVADSPGADDNASGIAGLLELARLYGDEPSSRTVRFVAFVNEEPPFFRTGLMGSRVHAHAAKERKERVTAMLSLEMLGYYSEEKGTQSYPPFLSFFYPDTADFISVVGNLSSRSLVAGLVAAFKESSGVPVESISTVPLVPGVDFSDHASFWKYGYAAAMITDTAFYRYDAYHTSEDTIEKLDFARMAEVVAGLEAWMKKTAK